MSDVFSSSAQEADTHRAADAAVVSGHTPGPWEATEARTIDGGIIVVGGRGEAFGLVADVTTDADARLIAAAPDLLEALDRASSALQRLHTDVEALMADSEGVYGLHGNGDPAPWDELREGGRYDDWIGTPLLSARNAWHDARAAIAKATTANSVGTAEAVNPKAPVSPAEQVGWRPIETAPKDGTHILCCDAGTPYSDTWTFNQRPPTVCHYWPVEGEQGLYTSVNEMAPDHPFPATHWMPLPTPPAEGSGR